tara:strand:- start:218 stop:556 length:339 start_codon:yes stop_codon:yes gene_type:complete
MALIHLGRNGRHADLGQEVERRLVMDAGEQHAVLLENSLQDGRLRVASVELADRTQYALEVQIYHNVLVRALELGAAERPVAVKIYLSGASNRLHAFTASDAIIEDHQDGQS